MSEHFAYDEALVPGKVLNNFARSLYRYLYFNLNMYEYAPSCSPHFREVIGSAVLCVRKSTHDFNIAVWSNCGYGVFNHFVCQRICDLYPNLDYFRKLFFVSAFILDMVYWFRACGISQNFALGPNLWEMIFRNNFERDFESRGGWQGLVQAATDFHEVPQNEMLPREHFLPATLEGILGSINGLNLIPEEAAVDEDTPALDAATATLESLQVRQMEIDDASVVEAAQSTQAEEGIEKNQSSKVPQVEVSKEESQPEVVEDRSGLRSSALGGIAAQAENLGEGTSGKSEESAQRSLGGRNLRKRRHDTPPKIESDEESDSLTPTKSKMEKSK